MVFVLLELYANSIITGLDFLYLILDRNSDYYEKPIIDLT